MLIIRSYLHARELLDERAVVHVGEVEGGGAGRGGRGRGDGRGCGGRGRGRGCGHARRKLVDTSKDFVLPDTLLGLIY